MLRRVTDNPDDTLTLDDLALIADLLYRCSYFHNTTPFFMNQVRPVSIFPVHGRLSPPYAQNGLRELHRL